MVTSKQCLLKYGEPAADNKWMIMFDVPDSLEIGVIPKKIWCNEDLVIPLHCAFENLVSRGYAVKELKTWDGCFNIRRMKGKQSMSLHSWGLAVDVNAFSNGYGQVPMLSPGFVRCFTDAGFDWGGTWRFPDGMHFQLESI